MDANVQLEKLLIKYSIIASGIFTAENNLIAEVQITQVDTTISNNQTFDIDFEGTDGRDIIIHNFLHGGAHDYYNFVEGYLDEASFIGANRPGGYFYPC